MSLYLRGKIWWFEFVSKGERIRQSTKTNNQVEADLVRARVKYERLFSLEAEQDLLEKGPDYSRLHEQHQALTAKLAPDVLVELIADTEAKTKAQFEQLFPEIEPTEEAIKLFHAGLAMGKGIQRQKQATRAQSLAAVVVAPVATPAPLPPVEVPQVAPEATLASIFAQWETYSAEKKSLADDYTRYGNIAKVIAPETKLSAITAATIEDAKVKLKVGRKGSTVNRHLALLRALFNLAIKRQLMTHNPVATVKFYKEDGKRERTATVEEFHTIANNCSDPHMKLIFQVGYYTGQRLNEICTLKPEQVALQARTITLLDGTTKNGEGHMVPIHDDLLPLLVGFKGFRGFNPEVQRHA